MSMRLETVWLWIKVCQHFFRIVGGVFFMLAIVAALLWFSDTSNNKAEPIVVMLGLISSLFLSLPSIAEYFLPNRKPVRHMTLGEILEFIPKTNPDDHWNGISRSWTSERFLKEDPRLRFRAKFVDDGIQNEDYKDEWANKHPNPSAIGYWYELYYDGAYLDRFILVDIDGNKASIPPPCYKTGKIKKLDYHVAKIFDSRETVDEYIRRSGLEVED
ncbi:hypothetical protein ACPUEK_15970 [Marinomonas gallaica]|uniref:hypothetical protein n=1 Tax=Marinomonas gallaica TaxID=1806667 RepID=UPI003CE4D9E0